MDSQPSLPGHGSESAPPSADAPETVPVAAAEAADRPERPAAPDLLAHLVPAPPAATAGSIAAIGKIMRAHGVHGEFKVLVLCSGPEHFLECVETGEVLLQREGRPGVFAVHVESLRQIPEGFLVCLEEVRSRDAAEALRGSILGLSEASLPACEPDTYYFHELEGLRVVAAADGTEIGTVVRVEENPGHDQLVVRPKAEPKPAEAPAPTPMDDMDEVGGALPPSQESHTSHPSQDSQDLAAPRPRRGHRKKASERPVSRDFYIPFVGAFVSRVDLANRRIEVTLPPGFAEAQR